MYNKQNMQKKISNDQDLIGMTSQSAFQINSNPPSNFPQN
jgi:hypothetical protein